MLTKLLSIIWPVTKAKLHRLVTVAGVAFAALTVFLAWWGTLGLSTEGKIGATIGILTTLAAGWQRARPKLDAGIDALPIPDGTDSTWIPPANAVVVPIAQQAVPQTSSSPTQLAVPIRPRDKGSVELKAIVAVAVVGLATCAAMLWVLPW